jgi:hypothetical protein
MTITPEAQKMLDRLLAIDYDNPTIDQSKIQAAFSAHLAALQQPDRPIELHHSFQSAQRSAQRAVRDYDWEAAMMSTSKIGTDYEIFTILNRLNVLRPQVRDSAINASMDFTSIPANEYEQMLRQGCFLFGLISSRRDIASLAHRAVEIVNLTQEHPQRDLFRAIWMPFVDAIEAGVFYSWVACDKVIIPSTPIMRCFGNRLHADGLPALQWADGEKYYFWHGNRIPEMYGATPSEQWKSEWVMQERNAELRQVLIERMGISPEEFEIET